MSADRDDEHAWVCRFHYDRNPPSPELPHAHLHINAEGRGGFLTRPLKRTHFPTLRLSLEHVIWFLIDEGGVSPKLPPEETLERLRESYSGFMERRTDIAEVLFP